jgi:fumarate reductase subunit D
VTDKDPRWQKYAALAIVAAVVAAVIVFRSRISADFWPLDSSRVGPNLVASLVQAAIVLIIAALIWPPTRRRIHRFMDVKIGRVHAKLDVLRASHEDLHEKIDRLHGRHDEHAQALEKLAARVEELHGKPAVKPVAKVAPKRVTATKPAAKSRTKRT